MITYNLNYIEEKWHSTKSEAQKCPEDQETQKEEAKEETGASNQSNQDTQTKEETEDQKCLSKPEDQDTQKEENKEEAAGESDQDTQTKEEVGTSDQKFLSEPVDQKEEAREEAEKLTVPATVVDSSIKPEEENDSTKKEDEETVSPKESDASSTDAPAKPEAKPISTRIKHPMTKLPKTLHEFGYTFKGISIITCYLHLNYLDGKLQNISSGEGFVFEVIRGDKTYNQQHYEALGEVGQYRKMATVHCLNYRSSQSMCIPCWNQRLIYREFLCRCETMFVTTLYISVL